jgi:photosystem II stability/assembly factor-like uncharacterized protein
MTTQIAERLYKLLPAIYQTYDQLQGESLRALLALLEQELKTLEADIEGLYENWFIETCDDWVVPYIGDLLDVQRLSATSARTFGQERRAYVANTLAYRRRKGTVIVVEQLAQDVSGWRGKAVEFIDWLARTQPLNTGVPTFTNTVDLRIATRIDRLDNPFCGGAYTPEVRANGRYTSSNIGLFLWRLQSYPITRVTARAIGEGYYTFNPLGYNHIPLFNQPQTKISTTQPSSGIHIPGILRRSILYEEIRQLRMNEQPLQAGYWNKSPVLQIYINGQSAPLLPEQILITDLRNINLAENINTRTQQLSKEAVIANNDSQDNLLALRFEVAVDPELGRLVFLNNPFPEHVEVSYSYGFSGDIGGGTYNRSQTNIKEKQKTEFVWKIQQKAPFKTNSLSKALSAWHNTTQAWQYCKDKNYIPIAKLEVPKIKLSSTDIDTKNNHNRSSVFSPGILNGLNVLVAPCSTLAIVLPGTAIDGQGRILQIKEKQSISFQPYKNQTLFLVIYYSTENQASIQVIPATAAELHYSERTYIRLSLLEINSRGKIISQSIDNKIRQTFKAGIVTGLAVKLDSARDGIIVTPGLAVNVEGERIKLNQDYRLNLGFQRTQPTWLIYRRRQQQLSGKLYEQPEEDWQIDLVEETALSNEKETSSLRLARIAPTNIDASSIKYEQIGSVFTPGIIKGLTVTAHPGENWTIITPGMAISFEGESISIPYTERLSLRDFPNQDIYLVLSKKLDTNRWKIQAVSSAKANDFKLAKLTLGAEGRLIDIVNTTARSYFKPGIIKHNQFNITSTIDNNLSNIPKVKIAPGVAINCDGKLIRLDSPQEFNLSDFLGQIIILYVAPLTQFDCKIDAVLEEVEVSTILLEDNATYGKEDLTIKIPADKTLQIIAANGKRPHIYGNISIVTEHSSNEPGELSLEGLLIEGQLVLHPGNLKSLSLRHCTLVPACGGLLVESVQKTETSETWSVIALAMYYVYQIRQMIALQFDKTLSPAQILAKLLKMQLKAATSWIDNCWTSQQDKQNHNWTQNISSEANYNQLQLIIEHSICGAINLTSTVPELNISDSIIDIDTASNTPYKAAISAPGSQVKISASTIFGSTTVLSLEASNSLFTEIVTTGRRQIGCVRYCYLPSESTTPRRYHCQPDRKIAKVLNHIPTAITQIVSDASNIFIATAGDGIYKSDNAGASWEKSNEGLTNLKVNALLIKDNQIIAGTNDGYLFNKQIHNTSWETITQLKSDIPTQGNASNQTSINKLITNGNEIFVATFSARVYISNGQSTIWKAPIHGLEKAIWNIKVLAIHPQNQLIFAGTAGTGIYYFNGEEWQRAMNINLNNQNITALAITNNGKIFAGTTSLLTQESGIYYSEDNGNNWNYIRNLTPQPPSLAGKREDNYSPLLAGEESGERFLNINTIAIHPQTQNIFVGTANFGLLRSTDQGNTWEFLTQLPNRNITALAFSEDKYIFVGTASGQIWRTSDDGQSWIAVNTGITNVEERVQILNELQPSFTSTQYGEPGYAQLSLNCASEIRMGADDGSEVGCFYYLKQPQREENLRKSLAEYLRFGLETNILYIT